MFSLGAADRLAPMNPRLAGVSLRFRCAQGGSHGGSGWNLLCFFVAFILGDGIVLAGDCRSVYFAV